MNYFVVTSLAKRTLRSCVPRGSPLFVSSQHVSSVMTRAVVASSNTRRYPNGLTCSFSSAADTDRVRMDQYRAKDSDEGVTGQGEHDIGCCLLDYDSLYWFNLSSFVFVTIWKYPLELEIFEIFGIRQNISDLTPSQGCRRGGGRQRWRWWNGAGRNVCGPPRKLRIPYYGMGRPTSRW